MNTPVSQEMASEGDENEAKRFHCADADVA